MIAVLGHWELGYHAPITEQYYWSFAMRDFEVDVWNMSPVSGVLNREREVELVEWATFDEYFEAHPDVIRVFLEPRTKHQNPDTIWLHDFTHPESCVYVFGAVGYNPTGRLAREQDSVVSVKTVQDKGVPWGHQIACIALYDRMVKSWQ